MILDGDAANASDWIKDGSDADFMADVIEASKVQPVVVDFWAPWCGPCRTLTPLIERAIKAKGGAVRLVKIDTDQHSAYAGQLQVQSIPTVYAFVDGKPVDRFSGAIPESKIKAFLDKLTGDGDGGVGALLSLATESLSIGDTGGAAQAYAEILQAEPSNIKALAGLARCYLLSGETDQAAQLVGMAPPDARDADLDGVRAALRLAREAPGDLAALEAAHRANPADHQAALDLAKALAGHGHAGEAVNLLLTSIAADREWNGGAARDLLLTVFEAAGQASEVTRNGRKRLSSILFS